MCRATPPAARALRLLALLLCAAPCLVAPGAAGAGGAGGAGRAVELQPAERKLHKEERSAFVVTCLAPDPEWLGPRMKPIPDMKTSQVAVAGNSSQKILIFSNISVDLSGNYTCRSKNAEYSPSYFTLTVVEPLSFAGAREQTAQQSDNATLQCAPRGNPAPEVSWLRNGAFVVNASAKLEVRKEGLLVRNVTRVDAGPYVCRAVQYLADDSVIKEHVINLTVQHEPEWHADYAKTGDLVYGYLGGLANLTCVAEAQPAGNITWLRGKSVVELGDNAAIFGDGRNSTLQLNLTAASAFGDYTCRANNALGARARVLTLKWGVRAPRPSAPQPQKAADARHALLRVDRPPTAPPPTPAAPADAATPAAAAAGPTSLDLTGLRLLVRPSGAPHAAPRVVDLPFNEDYEYTLPDLQPGSWYEVRAQWRNAAGLSEESPPGEIHTSDLAAPARAGPAAAAPAAAAALLLLAAATAAFSS